MEQSNACLAHVRRLIRDFGQLIETMAELTFVALALLILLRGVDLIVKCAVVTTWVQSFFPITPQALRPSSVPVGSRSPYCAQQPFKRHFRHDQPSAEPYRRQFAPPCRFICTLPRKPKEPPRFGHVIAKLVIHRHQISPNTGCHGP